MIMAPKAKSKHVTYSSLQNLAFAFRKHMWHLETFLCLESPICSLMKAAHAKAKLPSASFSRAPTHPSGGRRPPHASPELLSCLVSGILKPSPLGVSPVFLAVEIEPCPVFRPTSPFLFLKEGPGLPAI